MNTLHIDDADYEIEFINDKFSFSWLTVLVIFNMTMSINTPIIGGIYMGIIIIFWRLCPPEYTHAFNPVNWGRVSIFKICSLSTCGIHVLDHNEFIDDMKKNGIKGNFNTYNLLQIPNSQRVAFTLIYLANSFKGNNNG